MDSNNQVCALIIGSVSGTYLLYDSYLHLSHHSPWHLFLIYFYCYYLVPSELYVRSYPLIELQHQLQRSQSPPILLLYNMTIS